MISKLDIDMNFFWKGRDGVMDEGFNAKLCGSHGRWPVSSGIVYY